MISLFIARVKLIPITNYQVYSYNSLPIPLCSLPWWGNCNFVSMSIIPLGK